MLTTRVTVEGFAEMQRRLAEVVTGGEGTVVAVMNFAAQSTSQRAKNLIKSSSPAGNVHFRRNPDRYVRASAPGQPPAIDLGNLINSISFRKMSNSSDTAFAFASAPYAPTLEFGDTLIAPRPFMLPAFEAAVAAAAKQFRVEWEART